MKSLYHRQVKSRPFRRQPKKRPLSALKIRKMGVPAFRPEP